MNQARQALNFDLILAQDSGINRFFKRNELLVKVHSNFKENAPNYLGIAPGLEIYQGGFLSVFSIHVIYY
jgi:hypothetical protein